MSLLSTPSFPGQTCQTGQTTNTKLITNNKFMGKYLLRGLMALAAFVITVSSVAQNSSSDVKSNIVKDWQSILKTSTVYEVSYRVVQENDKYSVELNVNNPSYDQKIQFNIDLTAGSAKISKTIEIIAKAKTTYQAGADNKIANLTIPLPQSYNAQSFSIKANIKY